MSGDRLNRLLKRLYASGTTDGAPRPEQEAELLNHYRQNHPQNRRWLIMLNPWHRTLRFALLGLSVLILGVGACTTETTTQVEMGKQLHIALPNADTLAKSGDSDTAIREVVDALAAQPGVTDVNVNIQETADGAISLDVTLWGEGLETSVLTATIREDFPILAEAEIQVESLDATVTESWAERLGRQVFNIETDGSSDEEIKAQILQQLAEQGFTGDAEVEVITEGDTQEIKIMLEEDVTE